MPFIDTHRLETREPLPGWKGRYFHSHDMSFGYDTVAAGASIHEHAHENEEVWHVVEGELDVTIGGETGVAGPGFVAVMPPNTPHSVKALRDGRAIVVDHPRRYSVGRVGTR